MSLIGIVSAKKNKLRVFLKIGTEKRPHDLGGWKILRQFRYDVQLSLKTN